MSRALAIWAVLSGACRWGFKDAPAADAEAPDSAPDSIDALTCGYACAFDATTGVSTCAAPVTSMAGGTMDELVATIDMTGYSELALTAMVCNPLQWNLHVGDSPTNNGFGGDGGQFSNDAELQLVDQAMTLYSNQSMTSAVLQSVPGFVAATGCTEIHGSLFDQHVVFTGTATLDVTSPASLRLNPPSDTEGVPDALWYLGVNRTYQSSGRTGTGLQHLDICLR